MWLLAADETEHNPVIPAVGEIVLGLIAFAVLLFVLWKFVFPQFEKAYAARTEAIEGGLKRAADAQEEANRLLEDYKRQLAEARTEAAKIRDDARADAERITADLRRQAQEESARIVARGEEQLAANRQHVVSELRGEIGRLAVDLAGRIVGESVAEDARRNGTVDRFLDELDGMSASTRENS